MSACLAVHVFFGDNVFSEHLRDCRLEGQEGHLSPSLGIEPQFLDVSAVEGSAGCPTIILATGVWWKMCNHLYMTTSFEFVPFPTVWSPEDGGNMDAAFVSV
jgi:hypothetical protein